MNVHQGQKRYAILAAAVALGIVAFAVPTKAKAFSFFDWLTPSAQAGSNAVVPDATLPILNSAVNTDPNPNKGQRGLALTESSALISEAGPNGTPVDADTTPTGSTISLYVVRAGDTLSEIASLFGISASTVLWANNLASAKDIHPGDTLLILPVSGIQHTIKKGETIATIATTYGGDASDIASFNGLDSAKGLAVGTTIIIPGGEAVSAPTVQTKPVQTIASSVSSVASSITRSLARTSGPALFGYYSNPVPGGIITQGIHPTNGVDIGARSGAPIYAAADGKIIVSRTSGWNGGYGNYVVIKHANGTQTLYAHMSKNVSALGSMVEKGELIGYVGASGNATGPHLHFEVRGAQNPFAHCAVLSICRPQ